MLLQIWNYRQEWHENYNQDLFFNRWNELPLKYSTTFDRPIWSTASLNGPSASMMRPQCSRLTAMARQVADSAALDEYKGDSSHLQ